MKNNIKIFLLDQRFFTIIYFLAMFFIICFYQMTVENVEVIYPVAIALFFYFLYMIVVFINFMLHLHNLNRLQKNAVAIQSSNQEYQKTYHIINAIHKYYGSKIGLLQQKQSEDDRFLSVFIHNLKTPVTVSSLIIQRADVGELEFHTALDGLQQETERLTRQLNTLLDLQRLREMENDYEPAVLSLREELTSVINENKSLFIHNRVYPKLNFSLDFKPNREMSKENKKKMDYEINKLENKLDKEVNIVSDRILTDSKWNHVLLNQIISNAVKYSADGNTKHLYFDCIHEDNVTKLIIKDEGIGIPDYDLPRVFEPFFTGDNGREGYNSSGIGLYLCKQICDRLGQNITIENDSGCKVTISYLSKM